MSYKIGQIRKRDNFTYLNPVSFSGSTVNMAGIIQNQVFNDFAIDLKDNQFNTSNTYYINFRVKRKQPTTTSNGSFFNDDQNISLRLYQTNSTSGSYQVGSYQVVANNLLINHYEQNVNDPYAYFEMIFTPNNTYRYLGFVLVRKNTDYTGERVRTLTIDPSTDIKVYTLNNILTGITATKIGVQTRPGVLLCVNNQPIRVGRTGVYEALNDVPITFVGITAPTNDKIDKFILDYSYQE